MGIYIILVGNSWVFFVFYTKIFLMNLILYNYVVFIYGWLQGTMMQREFILWYAYVILYNKSTYIEVYRV